MKISKYCLALTLSSFLSFAAAANTLDVSGRTNVDAILEVVNDAPITKMQIGDRINGALVGLDRTSMPQDDPARYQEEKTKIIADGLQEMEDEKLILHDFLSGAYMTNLVDEEVDKEIARFIKQQYDGDRSKLIKTLQEEGRTYESFRRQRWEQFIIRNTSYPYVHPEQSHKVIISPLKIKTYYENHPDEFKVEDEVKLRTITIAQPPNGPPPHEIAAEVLQKIDAGTPFTEMASVYSSDSGRDNGGDRGWVDRKTLLPAITDAAFELKPGQHSGVIDVNDGDHTTCFLLEVDDVKPAHTQPLSEVQYGIEQKLMDLESKQLLDQWLAKLRGKSHITHF